MEDTKQSKPVNLFQEALNNPVDRLIVSKPEAHKLGQLIVGDFTD